MVYLLSIGQTKRYNQYSSAGLGIVRIDSVLFRSCAKTGLSLLAIERVGVCCEYEFVDYTMFHFEVENCFGSSCLKTCPIRNVHFPSWPQGCTRMYPLHEICVQQSFCFIPSTAKQNICFHFAVGYHLIYALDFLHAWSRSICTRDFFWCKYYFCDSIYNNNIYLLQLCCHPVTVVILHVNKTWN